MRRLHLLLIEDDLTLVTLTMSTLKAAGHTVEVATLGEQALQFIEQGEFDMVILDIMLPDIDGYTVLEALRQKSDIPVLMVTALSQAVSIERCFLLGADDYIVKPYKRLDLLNRLQMLAERLPPPVNAPPTVAAGIFSLDLTAGFLKQNSRVVDLTPIETRLFQQFLLAPNQPLPLNALFRAGWEREPEPREVSLNLVRITVQRLRDKIEADPDRPQYLLQVHGAGIMLNPDGTAE